MRSFKDYNPIAVFLFFLGVIVPSMFIMDPVLLCISLGGACALHFTLNGRSGFKGFWLFPVVVLAGLILNPLFNHNGATVLFVLNNNPVTAEAAMYGLTMGIMISGVLLWFRSFTQIMTSDKLLYIFGAVSPKLALILSMVLRYIPLFRRQITKTNQAQKAMGLYKEENTIDKLKGGMRIFSVMVTWALENGVITADSMTARGYGVGRRSQFALFKWRKSDKIFLLVTLACVGVVIWAISAKAVGYTFYPKLIPTKASVSGFCGYIVYAVLAVIPVFITVKEVKQWQSLQSKI